MIEVVTCMACGSWIEHTAAYRCQYWCFQWLWAFPSISPIPRMINLFLFTFDVLIDTYLISFGNSESFEKTRDWMKSAIYFSTSSWSFFRISLLCTDVTRRCALFRYDHLCITICALGTLRLSFVACRGQHKTTFLLFKLNSCLRKFELSWSFWKLRYHIIDFLVSIRV